MSLVVANASGPITVTIPLISSVPGRIYTVKDSGSASATNTVTIVATAGNTFESGVGSYVLNTPSSYISFIGNATTSKWRVLGSTNPDTPITSLVQPASVGVLGPGTGSVGSLTVSGQATLGNTNTGNLVVSANTAVNTLTASGQTTLANTSNTGSLAVSGTLTARNIDFTGVLTSNGTTFSGAPAGINSSGNVGIGAAAGATTLLVTGSQSNTGTLDVSGNTTVRGTLTAGGFTGKLSTGAWINSTDDKPRLFFTTNSSSIYRSADRHYFRNSTDTDLVDIDGIGRTTFASTDHNSITANGGIWIKDKGLSFRPIEGTSTAVNNSPWYGIGWANKFLGGGTNNSVQIAGYSGINFLTGGPNDSYGSDLCIFGSKVGIANTNPQATLDVSGNSILRGDLTVEKVKSSGYFTPGNAYTESVNTLKSGNGEGTYIGWNGSGGIGETNIICNRGGGAGGFYFAITDTSGNNTSTPLTISPTSVNMNSNLTISGNEVNIAANGNTYNDMRISFRHHDNPALFNERQFINVNSTMDEISIAAGVYNSGANWIPYNTAGTPLVSFISCRKDKIVFFTGSMSAATADTSVVPTVTIAPGVMTVNGTSITRDSITLSPSDNIYYGTSSSWPAQTPLVISAGGGSFNGNGSVYSAANDLILKGQDITGGSLATAASIHIQGGHSINGANNSDNAIFFNTAGSQRGFFNNSGFNTTFINVSGSSTLPYGAGTFFGVTDAGRTLQSTAASATAMSITAPNFIFSGEGFLAASDERIKKNIVPVTDSLDVVNKLNLVSFDYIDTIQHTSTKHGLIAQQVKEVYPDAVVKTKEFIPSVFKLASSCIKAENLTITSPVATGFSVNDKVRLYISDDTTYENEEKYETEVLEIISETEFVVKASEKFTQGMNVFIYGKQVDDFLAIDKPLIGLLAAGACKVLSQQVSTLQQENMELRSTIAAILEKYPL